MTQQVDQRVCRFPGCERPTVPSDGVGRPAEYCDDPLHTRAAAWRERQKLSQGLPVEARPVDAARQRASMITGQVTGMIEHLGQQLGVLVAELRTVGDPEAVEAQLEAVSSEAAEQVAGANARATRAEQAQRRAEAEKAEADAAATEATLNLEQITALLEQARLDLAEANRARDELADELTTVRATAAAEQAHAQEIQAQLRGELDAAQADLHATTLQRDAALARADESDRAQALAVSRADTAVAEAEQLRETVGELRGVLAVVHSERDAARAEAERERSHADQRVADLQAAFETQLSQRQAELAQAREEAQEHHTRAVRAEALLDAQTPSQRRQAGGAPKT